MASLSEQMDLLNEEETEQLLQGTEGAKLSRRQQASLLKKTKQKISGQEEDSRKMPRRRLLRYAVSAAVLLLVIGAGFGIRAAAQEGREYREAMQFFEENDLSPEGLTRAEIRAVYRDITTSTFTYDKTAQVIEKSLVSESVEGFEIEQHAPTPEQLKALWDYKQTPREWRSREWVSPAQPGEERIRYERKDQYKDITDNGEVFREGDFVSSAFAKYDGETLLWEAVFTRFSVGGYEEVRDGILVWGVTPATYYTIQDANWIQYAWVALVSPDGEIRWEKRLDNGHAWETVRAAVEEEADYAVLSGGEPETTLTRLSKSGELLGKKRIVVAGAVKEAVRYEDGFLIISGSWNQPDRLQLMDPEGNILRSIVYEADDLVYYLQDLAVWEGKIILSATAVPKLPRDKQYGRARIAYTLDKIFGSEPQKWDITSEELTPIVRDKYRAMLLICDLDKEAPQTFYTVEGSRAGALENEGGRLRWRVENIAEAFFSPATNAFTIFGTGYVVNYSFSGSGAPVKTETDEIVRFFE